MLFFSFIFIYISISSFFNQKFVLSEQKPFKINFYTSFSKQNNPIYNDISSFSLSNQDIFNYYYKHNIITKICIGTPKSCINLEISFSSKYSWICTDNYNSTEIKKNKNNLTKYAYYKSSSFIKLKGEEEKIMTSQGIKTANYSKDIIKIGDNSLHNEFFEFFIVDICNKDEFGELCIGQDNYYKYNNTYLSFIEQLKEKKIIDSSIISVKYINNTFGEILIGENYDIHKKKYLDFIIPSIEDSIVTSKNIESIFYLKQIKNINDMSEEETVFEKKIDIHLFNKLQIEIDFSSSVISVPEELFDNLIEIAFAKYILNKKICEIKIDENPNIKYLICDKKILNTNLEKLVIVFNSKSNLTIDLDDMFLPLNNKKDILFGIISEKNINFIYLGEIFLMNYYILFHNDKKSILFYNKEVLKIDKEEKFNFVFIGLIGICLVIVMYYMMSFTCEKKNNNLVSNMNIERFLRKKNLNKKYNQKYKRYKNPWNKFHRDYISD